MNFATWPALFVVDVEGNGTNPPDLVEVAALPVRDGCPDTSRAAWWLIRPPRARHSPRRKHPRPDQRTSGAVPPMGEIAERVHGVLGKAWICAHNAHTDYRVLKAHLPDWEPAGVLDTLRLAKTTYKDLPGYSLDALIKHTAPDIMAAPAQRHRATCDAFAAAQLLIVMAAHYDTWDQLVAAAVPPGLPGTPEPEEDPTLW
ncbi:3'-5' exonuclease [Streptomyces sp. NPDC094472]|uniref:3'-5' exonuclease n=1 Tax=unclassified Streptomyces TaxID=2593676 RepID=UPI00332DF9B2